LQYEAELHAVIKRHCEGILQLSMLSSARVSAPDLSSQYNNLCSAHLSIISGLANLISHLGGKEISHHNHEVLTCNAENRALKLYAATMLTECASPGTSSSVLNTNAVDNYGDPPHQASKFGCDTDFCV
jgi:hypothetical protein